MIQGRLAVTVTAAAVVLSAVLFLVASSGDVFWALDRSTGEVTFLLLSATIFAGLVRSGPHVDLALVAIAFGAVHIASTILGEHTSLGPIDAVVPFVAQYRGTWVGFGVISAYLYLAVTLTSWPLRRLPRRGWLWLHSTIYVAWAFALVHALGAGTDSGNWMYRGLDVFAVLAVGGTFLATRMRRRSEAPPPQSSVS